MPDPSQPNREERETPSEAHERGYITGMRLARTYMLASILRDLTGEEVSDLDRALVLLARRVTEREEAIAALRDICARHGDNDWPDNLHLRDVIEKHLGRIDR
jgi:hypothetical protein